MAFFRCVATVLSMPLMAIKTGTGLSFVWFLGQTREYGHYHSIDSITETNTNKETTPSQTVIQHVCQPQQLRPGRSDSLPQVVGQSTATTTGPSPARRDPPPPPTRKGHRVEQQPRGRTNDRLDASAPPVLLSLVQDTPQMEEIRRRAKAENRRNAAVWSTLPPKRSPDALPKVSGLDTEEQTNPHHKEALTMLQGTYKGRPRSPPECMTEAAPEEWDGGMRARIHWTQGLVNCKLHNRHSCDSLGRHIMVTPEGLNGGYNTNRDAQQTKQNQEFLKPATYKPIRTHDMKLGEIAADYFGTETFHWPTCATVVKCLVGDASFKDMKHVLIHGTTAAEVPSETLHKAAFDKSMLDASQMKGVKYVGDMRQDSKMRVSMEIAAPLDVEARDFSTPRAPPPSPPPAATATRDFVAGTENKHSTYQTPPAAPATPRTPDLTADYVRVLLNRGSSKVLPLDPADDEGAIRSSPRKQRAVPRKARPVQSMEVIIDGTETRVASRPPRISTPYPHSIFTHSEIEFGQFPSGKRVVCHEHQWQVEMPNFDDFRPLETVVEEFACDGLVDKNGRW